MNKKKLLSLALVVIMIATISFSSLAWFTDKDAAENKFNIGFTGDGDLEDQIFSVDVKEDVDGENGVDSKDFENLLPGDKFKKEAYITNTGAYDQYIRVVMTVTDWELIKNVVTINMDDAFNNNWMCFQNTSNDYSKKSILTVEMKLDLGSKMQQFYDSLNSLIEIVRKKY